MATHEHNAAWIGIGGLVLGVITLGWTVYSGRVPLQVTPQSQFICALRPDPDPAMARQVWTVLYQKNPDKQPKEWLYMVHEMGDGWNTDVRCIEIADRMNLYKEAGLISFEYRPDEKTPNQWVICARTKATQNCPPVVTLVPGDETEALVALQRVAGALMPGNPASYQTSAEITVEQPAQIPLAGLLAED
ncbi:COP23 domain-containing protein [Spirulina major]|uniref:COP23 domain-containing protein n=1 Tax=Spirulina major TaxID=270636 RepID=UPI0009333C47|nr:COP23 domain-containing protein [Spirulina major]